MGVPPETPAPPLWTRDFVLYTDAWMKDADLNTASCGTVGPLPFHGMSRYPYGSDETYPTDAVHRRFVATYNTRLGTRDSGLGARGSYATPESRVPSP